jgi:hypothetical protein
MKVINSTQAAAQRASTRQTAFEEENRRTDQQLAELREQLEPQLNRLPEQISQAREQRRWGEARRLMRERDTLRRRLQRAETNDARSRARRERRLRGAERVAARQQRRTAHLRARDFRVLQQVNPSYATRRGQSLEGLNQALANDLERLQEAFQAERRAAINRCFIWRM